MEKSDFKALQIIHFFSMSKEEQLPLIGTTDKEWFIEENSNNIGANYLNGLCAACLEYVSGNYFDYEHISEFRKVILYIGDHFDPKYWIFEVLSESEEWNSARHLANLCIAEIQPRLSPLNKPFIIEELIHVEHYSHASIIRQMVCQKNIRNKS